MRLAAKVDANQAEVVDALRSVGATVQILSMVGDGCVDLLVGRHGVNYCIEVKDGSKPPSERRLTPDQQKWHAEWRGQKAVVNNVSEALAVIGVYE